MGKKLTDADKWKSQRWFRRLPPYYKLALAYMHGICEIDGTWQINCPDLLEDTLIPAPFDLNDFIKCCNTDYDNLTGEPIERQRVMKIGSEFLWITGYIKEQQEGNELKTITPKGNFARAALYNLASKGILWEGVRRGFIPLTIPITSLPVGLLDPSQRVLYIDIDIEKDKEIIETIYNSDSGDRKGGTGGRKGAGTSPVPAGAAPGSSGLPVPDMPPAMTEKDFINFENQLVADGMFVQPLMSSTGIKAEKDLRLWIQAFNCHIVGEDNTSKDYKEYRKHFSRWLKKQQDIPLGPPKVKKNGTSNATAAMAGIPAVTPKDVRQYQKHQS